MQEGEALYRVMPIMDTNCDRVKHVSRRWYVFLAVAGNTAAFTNPSHRGSDLCLEILSLLGELHFVCFIPIAGDKDNLSFSPQLVEPAASVHAQEIRFTPYLATPTHHNGVFGFILLIADAQSK